MVALAGVRRDFHRAKQRVHFRDAEAAAGADRAVAGHGGGDEFEPGVERERVVTFGQIVGESATSLRQSIVPSIAGVSRTITAAGPKGSSSTPSAASCAAAARSRSQAGSSSSTTSGSNRPWLGTACPLMPRRSCSSTRRSCAACWSTMTRPSSASATM